MMSLQFHLHAIGIIFIVLAIVHIIFPRRFEWKAELSKLTLINRQIMHVHTFFIALFVLLNGLLFVLYNKELTQPAPLQRGILWGLLIFWSVRGLVQHFFFSSELWRGKKFETFVHILFSAFWIYVVVILVFTLQ